MCCKNFGVCGWVILTGILRSIVRNHNRTLILTMIAFMFSSVG